jgi:hypothetical protein
MAEKRKISLVLADVARGPHHHDVSGDREQPASRISGGRRRRGGHLQRDTRRQQSRYRPTLGELFWFVDQAAAGEGQARGRAQ